MDDGGSQGGYLIFSSDGQGNRNSISWQSRRVKRVVKYTLAAEALALVDAAQVGVFLAHLVSEGRPTSHPIHFGPTCFHPNLIGLD